MKHIFLLLVAYLLFLVAGTPLAFGQVPQAGPLVTPLAADNLDPAAFVQWVDGVEKPMPQRDGPRHVIWTAGTQPEWDGVLFGDSKIPGPRHLRIGFKTPITRGLGARSRRWASEHAAAQSPVSRRPGRRVAMDARRAHRTTAGRRSEDGRRTIRALGFPQGGADAGVAFHAHGRAGR